MSPSVLICTSCSPLMSCVPQPPEVCQAIDGNSGAVRLSSAAISPDVSGHFRPDRDIRVSYDMIAPLAMSLPSISVGAYDGLSAVDVLAHAVAGAAG